MWVVLVQEMREKYAEFGEICTKICGIYAAFLEICGVNDACATERVFTLDKMHRNAEKCDHICGNMRLYVNFCIIYP